jgi:DNA-binding SARP family transcriptional activator
MDYRILDRPEVVEGQQPPPLGGARQRALLGVLLLNRRQVVPLARLTERASDPQCSQLAVAAW